MLTSLAGSDMACKRIESSKVGQFDRSYFTGRAQLQEIVYTGFRSGYIQRPAIRGGFERVIELTTDAQRIILRHMCASLS